jgi:hypothetical protein
MVVHIYNEGGTHAQAQLDIITVQSLKLCLVSISRWLYFGSWQKEVEVLLGVFKFQRTKWLATGIGSFRQGLQVSVSVSGYLDIMQHQCNAEKSTQCRAFQSDFRAVKIWVNAVLRFMKRCEHLRSETSGRFATQSQTWLKADTENTPHWSDAFWVRRAGSCKIVPVALEFSCLYLDYGLLGCEAMQFRNFVCDSNFSKAPAASIFRVGNRSSKFIWNIGTFHKITLPHTA